MKAKIFYLNDEPHPITVRMQDSYYDPATAKGDVFDTLQAAEGKLYELDIPESSTLWVKKWQRVVMISYIYLPAQAQPVVSPQH